MTNWLLRPKLHQVRSWCQWCNRSWGWRCGKNWPTPWREPGLRQSGRTHIFQSQNNAHIYRVYIYISISIKVYTHRHISIHIILKYTMFTYICKCNGNIFYVNVCSPFGHFEPVTPSHEAWCIWRTGTVPAWWWNRWRWGTGQRHSCPSGTPVTNIADIWSFNSL